MKNGFLPPSLTLASKKTITTPELVTSAAFKKMVTDSGNALLRSHNRNATLDLYIFYDPYDPTVAFTDGRRITVNAGNPMLTERDGKPLPPEEAAKNVEGAVVHEIGHMLYTCFGELARMVELFKQGELAVMNLTAEEKTSYDEIRDLMKNNKACVVMNDPTPLKYFILRIFHAINNSIEDGREESLLINNDFYRFQMFAQGLEALRESHKHEAQGWDMTQQDIKTFLDLALIYGKYGIAGNYPGGFDAFEKAKPLINQMLETHKAREFSELTFRVLLCIWPKIKELIMEIDSQQGGQGQNGEGQNGESQQQDTQEGQKGQGNAQPTENPQGNASGENLQEGEPQNSEENPSGSNSNGGSNQAENGSQEEENGKNEEQSSNAENSSENQNNQAEIEKKLQEILDHIENRYPEERSSQRDGGQEAEKQAAAERKAPGQADPNSKSLESAIDQVMNDIADQKVRDAAAEEAQKRLKGVSKGFSKYSETNVVMPSESHSSEYILPALHNKIGTAVSSAARLVQRKLEEEMKTGVARNRFTGKKFRADKVVRNDLRYFETKGKKKDMPKVKVGLVIDESGSMSRNRRDMAAMTAAIVLYELFEKIPNLDIAIYGHTAKFGEVVIYQYMDFGIKKRRENILDTLCGIQARGGNIDIVPISAMAENLLKQDADKRIMFIVTDGQPHTWNPDMTAEEELRQAANKYSKKGLDIIVASIGDDEKVLKNIYSGQKFLSISDPSELPKKIADTIKRNM